MSIDLKLKFRSHYTTPSLSRMIAIYLFNNSSRRCLVVFQRCAGGVARNFNMAEVVRGPCLLPT